MKQSPYLKNNQGYIMLLSILFMGAIATSVVVSVLLLGLGGLKSGFDIQQGHQAKALADLCAEEALLQMRGDAYFTGTDTFEHFDGEGWCAYTITNTGGENRFIHIEAQMGTVFRGLNITVSDIHPNINIDDWQEFVF